MTIDKRYLFPTLLLLLNLGAALVALSNGDIRRFIYFTASGICVAAMGFI